MSISAIDIGIVISYMVGMVILGYVVSKSNETEDDYFVASRGMPWLPVGLSIAATMLSCNQFVGSPAWSYTAGMTPVMATITVPLALMVTLSVFLPIFYSMNIKSIYEFIERRLGPRTRLVSVLVFIMNSLLNASAIVYIPALILQRFTGISISTTVVVTVIISIVYTLLGGIKAVIWTDAIQSFVMIGGLIAAMVFLFTNYEYGFMETIAQAQAAGKMNPIDASWEGTLFNANALWPCLIGGFCIWFKYFAFDQVQVQRMLTAQSPSQLKRSFVISGIVTSGSQMLLVFLGVVLFVAFKGMAFDNQNDVMIHLISELPVGLAGLLLAGLFAAAMSSVDSLMNSMSAVFAADIYEPYFSKGKPLGLKGSQIISLVWGIMLIAVTVLAFSGTVKSIVDVSGSYLSYMSGPTIGLFLLAFFSDKANDKGVCLGTIAGFFGVMYFGMNAGLTWKWNSFVGAILTLVLGYLFSRLFSKDELPKDALSYTVKGYRKNALARIAAGETGVLVPGKLDGTSFILIGIFVVQFVILYFLGS